MLEEKDFQTIGELFDKKLDVKLKENNKVLKDEIVDEVVTEVAGVVNEAFGEFEGKVNKRVDGLEDKIIELDKKVIEVDKKVDLRPTLKQIMKWGDEKIIPLELDMDKIKYLHREEFDKLPPAPEISRILVERGLKKKTVQSIK